MLPQGLQVLRSAPATDEGMGDGGSRCAARDAGSQAEHPPPAVRLQEARGGRMGMHAGLGCSQGGLASRCAFCCCLKPMQQLIAPPTLPPTRNNTHCRCKPRWSRWLRHIWPAVLSHKSPHPHLHTCSKPQPASWPTHLAPPSSQPHTLTRHGLRHQEAAPPRRLLAVRQAEVVQRPHEGTAWEAALRPPPVGQAHSCRRAGWGGGGRACWVVVLERGLSGRTCRRRQNACAQIGSPAPSAGAENAQTPEAYSSG